MKVSKAIEILDLTVANSRADNTPLVRDAIKLGREALKALQYMRKATPGTVCTQLHGETPEDDAT